MLPDYYNEWERGPVYCLLLKKNKPRYRNVCVKGTLLEMNEVPNEAISTCQS